MVLLVLRPSAVRLARVGTPASSSGGRVGVRCQPPRPWRQNSQASSAVTRPWGFWTKRFMSQPYMTVCWMSRAARRVSVTWSGAGRDRGLEQLDQHPRDRRHHRGQALGILERELQRELRDRDAVVGAALAARPERLAPLVETDREGAKSLERLGLGLHGRAEILERLADALLEEREEQLVLALEVLVEPSQRLLRAIDDLLDRELGRAPLVDQRERRIQESLNALLRAGARGSSGSSRPRADASPVAFPSCRSSASRHAESILVYSATRVPFAVRPRWP